MHIGLLATIRAFLATNWLVHFAHTFDQQHCSNDTDIMEYLLTETALRYNRHRLPSIPVTVRIEMWVQEVTSVSEITQDFEIGLFSHFKILLLFSPISLPRANIIDWMQ